MSKHTRRGDSKDISKVQVHVGPFSLEFWESAFISSEQTVNPILNDDETKSKAFKHEVPSSVLIEKRIVICASYYMAMSRPTSKFRLAYTASGIVQKQNRGFDQNLSWANDSFFGCKYRFLYVSLRLI